LMINR